MNSRGMRLWAGVLAALVLAGGAQAAVVFFDDFHQFPAGTVLTETNYVPNNFPPDLGLAAGLATNDLSGENATIVLATNLLGGTRALFQVGSVPYQSSYSGSPTTGAQTNRAVTVSFQLRMPATTTASNFGGFAVNLLTTNPAVTCATKSCFTNGLESLPIVFINDGGQIYTFTNSFSLLTPVQIGSWTALAGTVMTNVLVLNYPAGVFSYSLNGTVLTNLPLPGFVVRSFDRLRLQVSEDVTNVSVASLGNEFALGAVRLDSQAVVGEADALFYIEAAKGQRFRQLDTNPPVAVTNLGNLFLSVVTPATSNSILSASLRLPGSKTNLALAFVPQDMQFELIDRFDSLDRLNSAYSNGVYRETIVGAQDGTNQPAFRLSGDAYPNAPHVTNSPPLDPTVDAKLLWEAFSGGTTNDFIQVSIENSGSFAGYQSPDFGQPGALTGTNTSFLIPANTLVVARGYCGRLVFTKFVQSDATNYPGVPGGVGYFRQTEFNLITTGLTNGIDLAITKTVSPNPVAFGSNLVYTITVTNQGTNTATGVTVNDALPAQVSYITDSAGGTTNGQSVICSLGTLAGGASTTLTITARATMWGQICNFAQVQATEQDYNPCNNDSDDACVGVEVHDLAVTAIKVPKRIRLSPRKPSRTNFVRVTIQNRGPQKETITMAALPDLVTLVLAPVSAGSTCVAPVAKLHVGRPQRRLPVTLKPKQKFTVVFDVTFTCATDPLKTTRNANHNDFNYTATVHLAPIGGKADADPFDDACPHGPLPYPGNRDPFPDGTIRDRGCGGRNPDHTFGSPVETDVVRKD